MWTEKMINNSDPLSFTIGLLEELCDEKRIDPPFIEKIQNEVLPMLEALRGESFFNKKEDALSTIRERIYEEVRREKYLCEIERLLRLHDDETFPWLTLGVLTPDEILANEDLMEDIYIRLCTYLDADIQNPVDGNIVKEAIETVAADYIG